MIYYSFKKFIYFSFGGAGTSLLHWLFYSCGERGLLCSCGAWASHCSGFSLALVVKNLPASAGDIRGMGSIRGLEKFSGVGNGNPLQFYCLENPMNRGIWQVMVHRVAKSQT